MVNIGVYSSRWAHTWSYHFLLCVLGPATYSFKNLSVLSCKNEGIEYIPDRVLLMIKGKACIENIY